MGRGALNHRRLPDVLVLDAAWAPVRLNDGGTFPYGYGWDLSDQRGHRRIGHTGSWQGFKTALYRYPEFDLSIVVLANLDQATPGPIARGNCGNTWSRRFSRRTFLGRHSAVPHPESPSRIFSRG